MVFAKYHILITSDVTGGKFSNSGIFVMTPGDSLMAETKREMATHPCLTCLRGVGK